MTPDLSLGAREGALHPVVAQIMSSCRAGAAHGCLFPTAGWDWVGVITIEDIERAISVLGVEHHQFSLLAENTGLKAINTYQYVEQFSRMASPTLVLDELIKRKRSLLIRHFQKRSPSVAAIFRSLVGLGLPIVDVVGIFSPPNSIATSPHADGHAILQLQLSGMKHWKYWRIVESNCIDSANSLEKLTRAFEELATKESCTEVTLKPGDMLFLPRRMLHHATNGDNFSFSLNFQFDLGWSEQRFSRVSYQPIDVFSGISES